MGRPSTRALVVVISASLLATTLIGTAHAAAIATGARSLESVNYPGRYVAHTNSLGVNASVTSSSSATAKSDATFTVTPGLAGGTNCVSFQAANGNWLRHLDYRVRVDKNTGAPTFLADATFCLHDGAVSGSVMLESFNYPGRFIRHRDQQLWLDANANTTAFRNDASFNVRAPWAPNTAKNPAIKGLYADPHITHLNGRYYIYPTTDGYAGWSGTRFKAFSSTDLVNWTDHGTILDLGPQISWADARAWAPAMAYKNGFYYFYFSADANIGVARSTSPTGPFTDVINRPLIAARAYSGQAIDPMVFTDTDGVSYLYWGQGALRGVRLNADMMSFDPAQVRTMTPSGFNEGAFVHKRNNTYYLTWSEDDTRSENYRVAYATGTSPFGPWTKRGVILQKNLALGIKGTGHHSIVKSPTADTWYITYHRFAIPAGDGTNREVAIDSLRHNTDGTIAAVVPSR